MDIANFGMCFPKYPPEMVSFAASHGADDQGVTEVQSLGWKSTRPGKLTVCYWKWPIEIVDLPIKNGDCP